MAVTIAKNEGKTWYEFPGMFHIPESELGEPFIYRAWVEGGALHFTNVLPLHISPEISYNWRKSRWETAPMWSDLDVPVALFRSVVRRLENSRRPIKLGEYGTFAKLPNNRISFTLPCSDQHVFDLEDLLTLADQL